MRTHPVRQERLPRDGDERATEQLIVDIPLNAPGKVKPLLRDINASLIGNLQFFSEETLALIKDKCTQAYQKWSMGTDEAITARALAIGQIGQKAQFKQDAFNSTVKVTVVSFFVLGIARILAVVLNDSKAVDAVLLASAVVGLAVVYQAYQLKKQDVTILNDSTPGACSDRAIQEHIYKSAIRKINNEYEQEIKSSVQRYVANLVEAYQTNTYPRGCDLQDEVRFYAEQSKLLQERCAVWKHRKEDLKERVSMLKAKLREMRAEEALGTRNRQHDIFEHPQFDRSRGRYIREAAVEEVRDDRVRDDSLSVRSRAFR